jgi:glycosyltransferase involved in cell wall biosynthesis
MEKKSQPLVTVIMPAFNAEKYIKESIQSIISQTYKNFELIICNDASSDKTQSIIDYFCKLDSRIKPLKNEENLGISKTINKCINFSLGSYIARMDADDIMKNDRLELQVDYLNINKEVYMVGGSIELIDPAGNIIKSRKYPIKIKEIKNKIFFYNPFCNPALMFRKEVFDKVGFYNSSLDGAEDLDLIARVLSKFNASNLDEVILQYRIHQGSISSTKARRQEFLTLYIRQKMYWEYGLNISRFSFLYNLTQFISMFIVPNGIKRKIFNILRS